MNLSMGEGAATLRTAVTSAWASLRTHWRLAALAVAAAAAVTFAVVACVGAHHERGLLDEQHEALAAAQTRVPLLLSYNYATLKQDLARSQDQATGTFKADYTQLLNEIVRSAAAARHISTKATVRGAGVVSQHGSDVIVLAFITQKTTAPGAAPSQASVQVEVTMRQVDGAWKIAGLMPR